MGQNRHGVEDISDLYCERKASYVQYLKFAPTILTKFVINTLYSLCCLLFKVDSQRITFASYRSNQMTGNLLYIYNEMKAEFPNKNYHLLFKKFDSSLSGKIAYFIHLVKAIYYLATSRFFIIDDFYFPVYAIHPRKGTEIIQLWHAAGIFKKFGLSTVGKPFGPSREYLKHIKLHSNYSRVYVSSKLAVPHFAEAFGMAEENVFPLGVPRTDYFYDREKMNQIKERFYSQYPGLRGKQLVLYAPTYRGKSHYQEDWKSPIDFSQLKEKLGGDFAVLIHLHPYMCAPNLTDHEFLYHIRNEFTIEELLTLTDLLITDYSSVIFDYSLLVRPMAFFAHDVEDYIKERDFYLDYQSMVPGPIFYDTKALAEWIKQGSFDLEKVKAFRDRFFDYSDGKASKRIVDHLLRKVE